MIHKTSPEIGGMGHPIKRKEDLRFIQGKGNYVDDVNLPGMVYGQMVRSPYAHARLKSISTKKAKTLPGVLAVITGQDLAQANLAWMPTLSHDKQMVLATGKVLFQSQEVAFVVAEDRYTAADVRRDHSNVVLRNSSDQSKDRAVSVGSLRGHVDS